MVRQDVERPAQVLGNKDHRMEKTKLQNLHRQIQKRIRTEGTLMEEARHRGRVVRKKLDTPTSEEREKMLK